MAADFGVGDEADIKNPAVRAKGRQGSYLINPQRPCHPGRICVPSDADDLRTGAWTGDELEVDENDFIIIELDADPGLISYRQHGGRPIS